MKTERGITLTSLLVYIMGVLIVTGILAVIMTSFEGNIKKINDEGKNNVEVDKFNIYFLKEVKKQGNDVDTISDKEILFTSGNKYIFKQDDNSIYLNNDIKIAENIEKCKFKDEIVNGKTVITVTIKAKNEEERVIEYVLSNEAYYSPYEDENSYVYEENNNISTTSNINSTSDFNI